jgi:hypothetical protein
LPAKVSEISLEASLARARARLEGRSPKRRSDAGRSRLPPAVEAELTALLSSRERPRMSDVHRALTAFCRPRRLPAPSRSTLYNAIERIEPPAFRTDRLPWAVRRTLHNVQHGLVPGHQVAFAAFNYGDTRALSFAAGLPWLCLYRAARLGGWRPKSRALLQAVAACRGIDVDP